MGMPELAAGWETMLLARIARGRIVGKVRLTKLLALLQMEGFPIPYRFQKRAMGPASYVLVNRAEAAKTSGYLEITEKPIKTGWAPAIEYSLTKEGVAFVDRDIVGALDGHDESEIWWHILKTVPGRHRFNQAGKALADYTHQILHWDSQEEFEEAYRDVLEFFETEWAQWEDRRPRDQGELLLAASIELAVEALRVIEPKVVNEYDDDAGKHFVVFNTEELREYVSSWDELRNGGEGDLDKELRHRFYALEQVATVYGYVTALSDDDLDEIVAEVVSSQLPQDS